MNELKLAVLYILLPCFSIFAQDEERNAHLVLSIRNELGEPFKGTILLIANQDTIPVTATWNDRFQADLLPGNYRLILKNNLFDDYWINPLTLGENEIKEIELTWKHKVLRLPELRFPTCVRW